MCSLYLFFFFFFSSRRRHTRLQGDWSSDVCSSDLRCSPRDEAAAPAVRTGWQVPQRLLSPALELGYGAGEPLGQEGSFGVAECWKQIGRASCREGVELSVGGVWDEKKNTEYNGKTS